ncbi:hypothetical protein GC173_06890 [bacterium]|nr:hypothetical protein [bacterium]
MGSMGERKTTNYFTLMGERPPGWIERALAERASVSGRWTPGPLFVLLRRQRRARFFLMRWEFWLNWGIPLSIFSCVAFPLVFPLVLISPFVSLVILEMYSAKVSRRFRDSGLFHDLLLSGQDYRSMRADMDAFVLSRSWMPVLGGLAVWVVVLIVLAYSGAVALLVATQTEDGQQQPKMMQLPHGFARHGLDRGLGLGNAAGKAAVSFVICCTGLAGYLLVMASPVLLFLGVYFATHSGVAAVIALVVAIHAIIIFIAIRSGRPSPWGAVGEELSKAMKALLEPKTISDEEITEMLLARRGAIS